MLHMNAVEASEGLQGVGALLLPQPVAATRPGVSSPCQRCADASEYAPASVRFEGELVCSFHAYGAWFDKPARLYLKEWGA